MKHAILIFILISTSFFQFRAFQPGIGWVQGEAEAVYHLTTTSKIIPPNVNINGFTQEVTRVKDGWKIDVKISSKPFTVKQSFQNGNLPTSLPFSRKQAHLLKSILYRCETTDEAVRGVVYFLRSQLEYSIRPDFEETPANVLKLQKASCVGATRTAVEILRALGIKSRPVVGIKFPSDSVTDLLLEGGVLHAWMEVEYPGAGNVYTDVLSSINWVPQLYIVLKSGDNISADDLVSLQGSRLERNAQRDRIFFIAPSTRPCSLWERPSSAPPLEGSSISGKLLDKNDLPCEGTAQLEGNGASVTMKLWYGNFFFTGLKSGGYQVILKDEKGKPFRRQIRLSSMDKRFVIFYSHKSGKEEKGVKE